MTPEARKRRRDRKKQKKKDHESDVELLKSFVKVGKSFSELELVVLTCGKLDRAVDGKKTVRAQIKELAKIIRTRDNCIKTVTKNRSRINTNELDTDKFYSSRPWQILRYQAFEKYGNKCNCCGATPEDGVKLHVDHIKPLSSHPELKLDIYNLQILCEDCNIGKLNQWDTNWRDYHYED